MVVVVTGQCDRPAYVSGQTLLCVFTFANRTGGAAPQPAQQSETLYATLASTALPASAAAPATTVVDGSERVSLATAQAHGEVQLDAALTRKRAGPRNGAIHTKAMLTHSPATDIGEPLFVSNAAVLVCDMVLAPGESRAFGFTVVLPANLPSSFRGTAVRHVYTVSLVVQRGAEVVGMLHVPFTIAASPPREVAAASPATLALPAGGGSFPATATSAAGEHAIPENFDALVRTPAGFDVAARDVSELWEAWMANARRELPRSLTVTAAGGIDVARVSLGAARGAYIPGEPVDVGVEFTGLMPCHEVLIELVSFETIATRVSKQLDESDATVWRKLKKMRRVFGSVMQVTSAYVTTTFNLAVPHDAPPSIDTDTVAHKWSLHFEFILGKVNSKDSPLDALLERSRGGVADGTRVVWDLPIHVVPLFGQAGAWPAPTQEYTLSLP